MRHRKPILYTFKGRSAENIKVKTEELLRGPNKSVTASPYQTSIKVKTSNEIKSNADSIELDKHRTNINVVMQCSNATPIRRYGDMGYMCCFCNEQFLYPSLLKRHTLDIHRDIQDHLFLKKLSMDRYFIKLDITFLICNICTRNIDTIEQLLEHLKVDHLKTIYTDVKNHLIPFKFATETLQCCICSKTFSKFKILQEHMHIHYRNYICDICDCGYFSFMSLRSHKMAHDIGTFKCDHCPKIFDTKNKRRLHIRSRHKDIPVLIKCGFCNETFNDFRKKEAHLVSLHGLKVPTPKCQACDKVFPDRNKLLTHVKRVHLMQKPYECSECDMNFFSSRELRNHSVKHSGIRSHKCSVCPKAFCRLKTLKEHMKIHDDIRRFKCEHCGQGFVQKCSWKGHMKSKHGEIV